MRGCLTTAECTHTAAVLRTLPLTQAGRTSMPLRARLAARARAAAAARLATASLEVAARRVCRRASCCASIASVTSSRAWKHSSARCAVSSTRRSDWIFTKVRVRTLSTADRASCNSECNSSILRRCACTHSSRSITAPSNAARSAFLAPSTASSAALSASSKLTSSALALRSFCSVSSTTFTASAGTTRTSSRGSLGAASGDIKNMS